MKESVKFCSPICRISKNYCDKYGEGNEIYIKREDLLPFYFGGNKARIAEAFADDAESKGCDCILTYGSSDSNMCRVVTMICRKRNIDCVVLSASEVGQEYTYSINSKIAEESGFPFYTCDKSEVGVSLDRIISQLTEQGKKVYYIYAPENIAAGVSAYKNTYGEISSFGEAFDYIFAASGTGVTQAGLICGKFQLKEEKPCKNSEIIGISVSREKERETEIIKGYMRSYLEKAGVLNADIEKAYGLIRFTDKYNCGGYGMYDSNLLDRISELMYNEGIGLDPVYSGKAFFGMLDYLKDNGIKGKKILFINTGSAPLFFDRLNEINKS